MIPIHQPAFVGALATFLLASLLPGSSLLAQQGSLVPDMNDPATFDEAGSWLEATTAEVESGRKVIVPTPEGPLPFLVVDRSAMSAARQQAVSDGGSAVEAARWAAKILAGQTTEIAKLRTARTALASARPPHPAARSAEPPPRAAPRTVVIRGTPDAAPDRNVRRAGENTAPAEAPSRTVRPAAPDVPAGDDAAPPATERAGELADVSARELADVSVRGRADPTAIGDAAPLDSLRMDLGDFATVADPGEPAGVDPTSVSTEASSPREATPVPAAVSSTVTPTGSVGGGGGGARRAGTWIDGGVLATIGLGLLAALLGVGILVARRSVRAPSPSPPSGPRIDLSLQITGPRGTRPARFRTAPVTVGRDPTSDLVLADPSVSRRHALIVVHRGELWIEDAGSSTGLEVDGRKVDRAPLRRSMVTRLGDTRITVR